MYSLEKEIQAQQGRYSTSGDLVYTTLKFDHVPIMQWFAQHFRVSRDAIFIEACFYGSRGILNWLLDTNYVCSVLVSIVQAINYAARGKTDTSETFKWLYTHIHVLNCKLTHEVLRSTLIRNVNGMLARLDVV
jgi:hypothetical protein